MSIVNCSIKRRLYGTANQKFSITGKSNSGQIGYTFTLRVTEDSVDYTNNLSYVTVQAILRQTTSGPGFSGRNIGVSCTVDGAALFSSVEKRSLSGTEEHVYYTCSQAVPHGPDGSRVLQISGKLWSEGSYSSVPAAMTLPADTMTLTPIPRFSTVRAVDAAIGSACAVAIVSPHADFTHTVAYRFGGRTGYLTADGGSSQTPEQLPGGMVYWTVPETFYDQMPNKKWDTCYLTCTTFYNGAQVGPPQQTSFLATAAEASCAPILSPQMIVVDSKTVSIAGGGKLIRYCSTLRCTPNARARNSASIVETRVNGQLVTGSYLDIPGVDTNTYTFYTRDSRGWEAQTTQVIPLIPYEKPTVRFTARRTEPGSTTVEVRAEGTFYAYDFGLKQNTVSLRYAVDSRNPVSVPVAVSEDGTFSATFYAEGVDYSKATRLTVIAEDLMTQADARVWVQAGQPVFHWDRDRFAFCVPVELASSVSGLYIRQGSTLQSRFDAWGEPGQLQPVWLFGIVEGQPVQGLLAVGSDGSLNWSGSPQLEFTAGKGGQVLLPEKLTCLSPEPIVMEE